MCMVLPVVCTKGGRFPVRGIGKVKSMPFGPYEPFLPPWNKLHYEFNPKSGSFSSHPSYWVFLSIRSAVHLTPKRFWTCASPKLRAHLAEHFSHIPLGNSNLEVFGHNAHYAQCNQDLRQ
jgi:hypothetical protein